VGIVEGGTSVNTIAQNAKMLFEYRSDDRECLEYMQNFFNEQIEKAKKDGKAEIEVKLIGDRPCDGEVDKKRLDEIVSNVISICENYSGIKCTAESGSTDANIPMSLGVPAVCVGTHLAYGAHTRGEKVLISSIPVGMKISAHLILEYFNK
jgi:di/tripeptidase